MSLGLAHADDFSSFQSPFGFELEKATFAEIRTSFGEADEFDIPESHHEFGICYETENSDEIIVFKSGHEFGGPEKLLLGVEIHAKNTLSYPCSASSLKSSELKIGDLKLGLTQGQFVSLSKHDAKHSDQGHLSFNLWYRRDLTQQEKDWFERKFSGEDGPESIDVGLGIWCRIIDDQATEVGVWQVSTY